MFQSIKMLLVLNINEKFVMYHIETNKNNFKNSLYKQFFFLHFFKQKMIFKNVMAIHDMQKINGS